MRALTTQLGFLALALTAIGCGQAEPQQLTTELVESAQSRNDSESMSLAQSRYRQNNKKKADQIESKKIGVIVLERALRVQTKIKTPIRPNKKQPNQIYKNCTIPAAAQLESVSEQGDSMTARVLYPKQIASSLGQHHCRSGSYVIINSAALHKLRGLVLVAAHTSFEKAPVPVPALGVPERKPQVRPQPSLPYDPSFDPARCAVYPNRGNVRISGAFKDATGVVHLKALAVSRGTLRDQAFRLDECKAGTQLHAQLTEVVQSISPVRALSVSIE